MVAIQEELTYAAVHRAFALLDANIQDSLEKQHEFTTKAILADELLTKDEKPEAIILLNKFFDSHKLISNKGTKRICENCQVECLATLYCEYCVRNYLKAKFSNWTSGNSDVDNLIQRCQLGALSPYRIVEWIPYNSLKNIKYLTRGGCSEIYTADWIDGFYDGWDSKEKQLKRYGEHTVILKKLENVGRSWFEEGRSHTTISSKFILIVQCYGLTRDSSGNYMLVMRRMKMNLGKYLQQNYHILSWKDKIRITRDVIHGLSQIHQANAVHRDLHSGNVLYHQIDHVFKISDLGFCGPADKPLNSVYGNLPYIAPEVIAGKETSFASDIYSIGMLMWEISSGIPPFSNLNHNCELAMNIINGMRPKIVPGTPLEYKKLIEQCWDADPEKRPNVYSLANEIQNINRRCYENENKEQINHNLNVNNLHLNTNFKIDFSSKSKIYHFRDFPEPRNATKEEQEAYHSIQDDLIIPDSSDLLLIDKMNKVKEGILPSHSYVMDEKDHVNSFRKVKLNNNKGMHVQSTYNNNIGFKYVRNYDTSDDDDKTYCNPNLHSEGHEGSEGVRSCGYIIKQGLYLARYIFCC